MSTFPFEETKGQHRSIPRLQAAVGVPKLGVDYWLLIRVAN